MNSTVLWGCDISSPLVSSDSNALSPCFIAFIQFVLSSSIVISGSVQLLKYSKKSTYGRIGVLTPHQKLKVTLVGLLFILVSILFSKCLTNSVLLYRVSYFTSLFNLIIVIFPLHILEVSKSHIPTATLLFYWPSQFLIFLAINVQQVLSKHHQIFPRLSTSERVIFVSLPLISGLIFILEYLYYKPNKEFYSSTDAEKVFLSEPDVFSKLSFSWMNKLLQLAYDQGGLEQQDLPPPPRIVSTEYNAPRLLSNWNKELHKENPSLMLALMKTFGLGVLGALTFDMAESIVSFIQPLLLRKLIQFFKTEDENPLIIKGLTISILMFLTNLASTAFYNQYMIMTVEVSQGCKAALMNIIYNKAMRLAFNERNSRSTGDIINHVSVDVSRIESLASYVQTMVSAPTRLVLCLWSLYWLLGKSTFIGIITMAIMIPLNTFLVKSLRSFHKEQMKLKDKRTSFVAEILQNVKSIKLYAWEEPMLEKLKILRDDKELSNLNKIGILSAGINFAWTCVPFFVSCSTFAMFAYISDIPLSPEIVFPALSLFDLLSDPIFAIPSLITALIECNVSLTRIVSFLRADEMDTDLVTKLPTVSTVGKQTVFIDNATFLWNKPPQQRYKDNDNCEDEEESIEGTKAPALRNINFQAKKGDLICVLGKVGSGKSTLLRCILGELYMVPSHRDVKPTIEFAGSVAYCSQVPWILNASFKQNIIFGHKYDEDFYNKTISVCQLLPDLEILPDGHETLVGEKGISLSGGQKARLSLARAIYARADVYLLDDVLSAVDAHVGQKLIDCVLGKNGILRSKTRILCTNSIKVLDQADDIYLIKDNTLVQSGSIDKILNDKSSEIYKLIQDYGFNEESNVEKGDYKSSSESPTLDDPQLTTDVLEEGEYEGVGPLGVNFDENTGEELIRFENKTSGNLEEAEISTLKAASVASYKVVIDDIERRMNQTEEKKEKGHVKWSIFKEYANACSYSGIIITLSFVVITVGLSICSNYWLMHWSEDNIKNGSNKNVFKYVGIYALLGIGSGFFTLIRAMCMWTLCSIRASKKLHSDMAKSVLNSPLQFFETTPLGRILNRFSQDMRKIDSALPRVFSALFSSIVKTIFTLIIIGYNMPFFVVIIIFLSFIYSYYQKYYINTIRDLKRIMSISKSPILALIQESLNGCDTIRAYRQISRFSFINSANIDNNQVSSYCYKSTNRWLSTRLQFIGSLITLSTSFLALSTLYSNHRMSSGLIGLIMSYAIRVTSSLSFIVRRSVEIESDVICCERIFEYCKLKPECDEDKYKDKLIIPPNDWPREGTIEFNDFSTKYRENLDPVLKKISFSILNREKIGIVGRTGAGKSSLVLSIFRLIEPISGNITIDGINTSYLRLHDLRKKLSIIPQDAQCIEGTVRYNLDPLGEYDDTQIWEALRMSRLEEHIHKMSSDQNKMKDPLDCLITESGGNLSVGQRQLVCLARVLLKTQKGSHSKECPSKILILDEATSSIDTETDNVIQQTIRTRCDHLTILTIAHRLNTIMDSDRILVLDNGEIAEFASPNELLSNPQSQFYNMCVDGGYINDA